MGMDQFVLSRAYPVTGSSHRTATLPPAGIKIILGERRAYFRRVKKGSEEEEKEEASITWEDWRKWGEVRRRSEKEELRTRKKCFGHGGAPLPAAQGGAGRPPSVNS